MGSINILDVSFSRFNWHDINRDTELVNYLATLGCNNHEHYLTMHLAEVQVTRRLCCHQKFRAVEVSSGTMRHPRLAIP